jgi:hypothetical protein
MICEKYSVKSGVIGLINYIIFVFEVCAEVIYFAVNKKPYLLTMFAVSFNFRFLR